VLLIAIIPVTKIPLSNRPMMDTLNKKFLIDLRQMTAKARQLSEKSWKHRISRGSIAVLCNVLELGIAILLPDFDSIMALMGSALCFTICVILPIVFYLKLFSNEGKEISMREKGFDCYLCYSRSYWHCVCHPSKGQDWSRSLQGFTLHGIDP
jgi:vesicular inhibitory amino acid transporter